jgi:hypothetical protein
MTGNSDDVKNQITGGQTFVVDIKYRQNHTWQGVVKWVEQKKELPFRSALELIKLMDSAMEETEPEKNEDVLKWQDSSDVVGKL